MGRFTPETAGQFYAEHREKSFFPNLSAFICSDVCIGLQLVAAGAVQEWWNVIGPTNTLVART